MIEEIEREELKGMKKEVQSEIVDKVVVQAS